MTNVNKSRSYTNDTLAFVPFLIMMLKGCAKKVHIFAF